MDAMNENNKKIVSWIIVLLVVVGGVVYYVNRKDSGSVLGTDSSFLGVEKKTVCYYKETKGDTTTDFAFTSIKYGNNDKVSGIINWLPGEKDSLVGGYEGVVEANAGMAGYPSRLNVIYTATGEGQTSKQQEIIIVGASDIKTGVGEKTQDANGVWQFKNINNLTYSNALPLVDCASVPDRIKADYSQPDFDDPAQFGK